MSPSSVNTANNPWTAHATDLERGQPVAEGGLERAAVGAGCSVFGSAAGAVLGGLIGGAGGAGTGLLFSAMYYCGQAILAAGDADVEFPKAPFKELILPAMLGGGVIGAGILTLGGMVAGATGIR